AYTSRPGAVGAAYLLRSGVDAIVLDLGQGAFTNLAGEIEPSALRAVVVSHLHPDHFIDLVPLRHYLLWDFDPPRRVAVLGPAGLAERIDALHDEVGFSAASLDVAALGGPGLHRAGAFSIDAGLVRHTDESYAFRVTAGEGPGLVYSGDCGNADDLRPLIRPGDTLLSEASFGTDSVAHGSEHLNAADVGRVAATTGAGRVLLTHMLMGHDREATAAAVRALAGVDVSLVDPGDRFSI
ncbi:MAG: MBL fold metallo-hydrolase, partial [Chloroflexota bacterium]|nr:MBL fold metallo-hydrolase [Chloroflexota bacterium]